MTESKPHRKICVFATTSPDLALAKMKCRSQEPDPTRSHGKEMTEQTFKKSRHPDRIPFWKNLCSMLLSFYFFWPPQHRPKSPRVEWVCAISLNRQIGKIMPAKQRTDKEFERGVMIYRSEGQRNEVANCHRAGQGQSKWATVLGWTYTGLFWKYTGKLWESKQEKASPKKQPWAFCNLKKRKALMAWPCLQSLCAYETEEENGQGRCWFQYCPSKNEFSW